MGRTGTLSAVAVALLAGKDSMAQGMGGDVSKDVSILNVALGLEHEAINAYQLGAGSGLLQKPVLDVVEHGPQYQALVGDLERSEYFVKVRWLATLDAAHAFNEVGLFGNQNTVCQPTTPKWRHTVERLKQVFTKWEP